MELKDLIIEYDKLAKKHKLPDFKAFNEDFEIEKIERESDCLLRVARKVAMEKILNSLSFIEMLLNPMNAPRMYFPFIKEMNTEDKKKIDKIYGLLAELTIDSLKCEIIYDEKKEADLILQIFSVWKSVKADFSDILDRIKKPGNNTIKEKSYYG